MNLCDVSSSTIIVYDSVSVNVIRIQREIEHLKQLPSWLAMRVVAAGRRM